MLTELVQLKRLVEECEIQLSTLAHFCKCSPTSIKNYISGVSLPTGARLLWIQEGLAEFKKKIDEILPN